MKNNLFIKNTAQCRLYLKKVSQNYKKKLHFQSEAFFMRSRLNFNHRSSLKILWQEVVNQRPHCDIDHAMKY